MAKVKTGKERLIHLLTGAQVMIDFACLKDKDSINQDAIRQDVTDMIEAYGEELKEDLKNETH